MLSKFDTVNYIGTKIKDTDITLIPLSKPPTQKDFFRLKITDGMFLVDDIEDVINFNLIDITHPFEVYHPPSGGRKRQGNVFMISNMKFVNNAKVVIKDSGKIDILVDFSHIRFTEGWIKYHSPELLNKCKELHKEEYQDG